MELSIQERLKDLRVERGLTLEQLEEQVNLSKSALGSYEAKDFKDISHYAIIKLAKFYGVTADYLLGLSQTRNHPNADLADLRLSDDMIELLKSGLVDNSLLCELATHPDFPQLMADLEIYVNGIAGKQVQSANAIVDAVSATIMKQHNPGLSDPQLRQLIAAHIDDDSFCRYVICLLYTSIINHAIQKCSMYTFSRLTVIINICMVFRYIQNHTDPCLLYTSMDCEDYLKDRWNRGL